MSNESITDSIAPEGCPAPICSAFWKCAACPLGECYVQAAKKPRQCVAGMPIQSFWRPTTEESYNAATVVINFDSQNTERGDG